MCVAGYVTDRGEINHSRMEQIFVRLAAIEETVFAVLLLLLLLMMMMMMMMMMIMMMTMMTMMITRM